jgi:hypothetical protein
MEVFVGVDPDDDSTPSMIVLHARHVAEPFCETGPGEVTPAGRVDGTVTRLNAVRLL